MSSRPEPVRGQIAAVTWPAVTLLALFIVFAGAWPETARALFTGMRQWIEVAFGWVYVVLTMAILVYLLRLGLGAIGAALLAAGCREALQAVAIAAALPLALVFVVMMYGFEGGFAADTPRPTRRRPRFFSRPHPTDPENPPLVEPDRGE